MNFFKNIIYEKTIRPVRCVSISDTITLSVEFENYTVTKKINNDLRMFFITLKDVSIKKIVQKQNVIRVNLGYFDLFGILEGDTVEFSNSDIHSFKCLFL